MHHVTAAQHAPTVFLTGSGDLQPAFDDLTERGARVVLAEPPGEYVDLSAEESVCMIKYEAEVLLQIIETADLVVSVGDPDGLSAAFAAVAGKPLVRYEDLQHC